MSKVTAVVQAHTHNSVARLNGGEICGKVGICAGMRLNVRKLSAIQLASTITRKILDNINLLATAIIALARQAFCILVRKNAAHCLHHST